MASKMMLAIQPDKVEAIATFGYPSARMIGLRALSKNKEWHTDQNPNGIFFCGS